jgi:hypothetical protein
MIYKVSNSQRPSDFSSELNNARRAITITVMKNSVSDALSLDIV